MRLFRSMKEGSDGMPVCGPSGRLLGVRPGNAATPDVFAMNPVDLVLPGQGGMSVLRMILSTCFGIAGRQVLVALAKIRYGISRWMIWVRTSISGKIAQGMD
jgi:hypothetical protein